MHNLQVSGYPFSGVISSDALEDFGGSNVMKDDHCVGDASTLAEPATAMERNFPYYIMRHRIIQMLRADHQQTELLNSSWLRPCRACQEFSRTICGIKPYFNTVIATS